jgi:hypothetical protein
MTRYLFLASLLFLAPLLSTAQLEENKPCMDFTDPLAVASAAKPDTSSECTNNQCGGGCCRYHTAFLTCDEDNDFPHQQCICNGLTEAKQGTGSNVGPVAVTPVEPPSPAPVTTPPPTAAPVPSCASKSMSCTENADCCSNFCGIVPRESGQTSIQTSECRSVSTASKEKITEGNRGGAGGGTIVVRNGGGRKLIRGSKN